MKRGVAPLIMAWFTAIILPAAALACAAFFIFIIGAYQRSGGPIR